MDELRVLEVALSRDPWSESQADSLNHRLKPKTWHVRAHVDVRVRQS
jgi:hypothetical protein